MKILVWNCQGVGGPLTVSSLKEQTKLHTPDMVMLLETKTRSCRYGYLRKVLGMDFMHAVDAKGVSGGLCLFWKEAQQVALVKYSDFFIEVLVTDDASGLAWRLFGIYASTDAKIRKAQWLTLHTRMSLCPEACLLIGDFNDILDRSEKQGGNVRSERSMLDFRSFVADNRLLDLGFVGHPFTWRNRRQEGGIQERLDRALGSAQWLQSFPEAKILHEVVEGSDHSMLILQTHAVRKKKRGRFIYDPRWGTLAGCKAVVANHWAKVTRGPKSVQVIGKLSWVRKGLLDWKRREWRNSRVCIDSTRTELRSEYKKPVFDAGAVKVLESQLHNALKDEEIYWKLKSRVQWLNEGDKNTKFFHTKTIARRRRNLMKGLEDGDGQWCEKAADMQRIALGYFSSIFTSDLPNQINEVTDCVERTVQPQQNTMLVEHVTEPEIVDAVKALHPTKSPGPDGFTGSFYHHYWKTIGGDVIEAVNCFFESGRMPREVNRTYIVLIPKVDNPTKITQWRPIALCNVLYKIIAKVLTNRLKRVLPSVISVSQSAFVQDRLIMDNILIVHEILHSMKSNKSRGNCHLALKLDMAKAYDRVEWPFLEAMMTALGFHPRFCGWVRECISTVSYEVLVNGEPTGNISPSRGIRQGDPLSPFLFLICAEGLSAMIKKAEVYHRLQGFRFSAHGNTISHLFFADDSVLFCRAEETEVACLKRILQRYELGSGQRVNLDKSSALFSPKCPAGLRQRLVDTIGVREQDGFGRYLGLQADFGASKKAVFEGIRKRLAAKLLGWSEQFLSQAGKEILIKAVALALPTYAMSCFKLPVSLCKEIEGDLANFWWKTAKDKAGVHWISWQKLSKLKHVGGLGFRDLICFNLALLAKTCWRIYRQPDSLLARVLHDKYCMGSDLWSAEAGAGSSWGWKSLVQGRRILEAGVRWRVGNGESIRILKDRWFPQPYSFQVQSRHPNMPVWVKDLIDSDTKCWRYNEVCQWFGREEAQVILKMPLSSRGCPDKPIWHFTKHGDYTVKSGYELAESLRRNGELARQGEGEGSNPQEQKRFWKGIWSLKVAPKIKSFLWRGCLNTLAVRDNLRKRHLGGENKCGLCDQEDETQVHLFFRCEFARAFWFACPIQLDTTTVEGGDFASCWDFLRGKYADCDKPGELMQVLAYGLWRIWKSRNSMVFQGTVITPREAADLLTWQVGEFRGDGLTKPFLINEFPRPPEQTPQAQHKWGKPRHGVVKVNCDGAWNAQTMKGGYGWVIRDFVGWMLQAGGYGDMRYGSALTAEVDAIRAAVVACQKGGFSNIIVESDSLSAIQMVNGDRVADAELDGLLFDIHAVTRELQEVTFTYAPRSCNMAAHEVAAFVCRNGGLFWWDFIPPDWLFNILACEANVSVRL